MAASVAMPGCRVARSHCCTDATCSGLVATAATTERPIPADAMDLFSPSRVPSADASIPDRAQTARTVPWARRSGQTWVWKSIFTV